jgi:hypothetical protein
LNSSDPGELAHTEASSLGCYRLAMAARTTARMSPGSATKTATSPLARATPERVEQEAAQLRELLAATLPPFLRSRRELTLEAGAPPLLAAFWAAMGWSELFVSALAHPDRERGAEHARTLMSEYVRDGATELRVRDLPASLRLVEVDSQGVGFMFTDETQALADPPVLGVASESSELQRVGPSYLRHVAGTLSELVFRRWYTLSFELGPEERLPGEPALPLLCPDLRRLDAELWVRGGLQKTAEGSTFAVAFRTSAALLAWLSAHPHFPVGTLSVELPEARLPKSSERELLQTIGAEPVRSAGGWHAVGTLLGEPVLARSSGEELGLFVGRRERHALEARLRSGAAPSTFVAETIAKLRRAPEPEVARPPVAELGLEQHRQQAREFAAWVAEVAPEHLSGRRALELEPDAPGAVAALWGALGASERVKRRQFWPPARAASRAAAGAALARWFEDSRTRDLWNLPAEVSPEPEAWLPHPFRLVEVYVPRLQYDYLVPNASYLDFANESSGALDPPVVRVRAGSPKPTLLAHSYVRYVSSLIAEELTDSGRAPALSTIFAEKGTPVCSRWFDGLYRLAPGIWFWCRRTGRIVSEDDAREDAERTPLLLFRELRGYFEFCEGLGDAELAAAGRPSKTASLRLTKAKGFDPESFDVPGLRLVRCLPDPNRPRDDKLWAASGRLFDAPVYLSIRRAGKSTSHDLFCAETDAPRVKAWLDERGVGYR